MAGIQGGTLMQRLKRKHARIFWALVMCFLSLEGLGWCLRTAGERLWDPRLLELSSWLGILGFLPFLASCWIWRRRLRCPNCHDRGRSGSVRLNRLKTDCCKSCGRPILFDDQMGE